MIIAYPFDINYKIIASFVAKEGVEVVKKDLISVGWSETIATVIIRTALRKGWGS